MSRARFVTKDDEVVIKHYSEPKVWCDNVWCIAKEDSQGRYFVDPDNPDNPQHPEGDKND